QALPPGRLLHEQREPQPERDEQHGGEHRVLHGEDHRVDEEAVGDRAAVVGREVPPLIAREQRPARGRHQHHEQQRQDEQHPDERGGGRGVEPALQRPPHRPVPDGGGGRRRAGQRRAGHCCDSTAVISSLFLSRSAPVPSTASRTSVSHGLLVALNACWKLIATGVSPAAATSLIVTRRGSDTAYLLSARSERDTTSRFLPSTSTCASSDISQDRKFQACGAFSESLEMPIPSPPTNVEEPPFGPGMPATPTSKPCVDDSRVAG